MGERRSIHLGPQRYRRQLLKAQPGYFLSAEISLISRLAVFIQSTRIIVAAFANLIFPRVDRLPAPVSAIMPIHFASLIRAAAPLSNGHPLDQPHWNASRSRVHVAHRLHTLEGSSYSTEYICLGRRSREQNGQGSNWSWARMEHIAVVSSTFEFESDSPSRITHDSRPFYRPFEGKGVPCSLAESISPVKSSLHSWISYAVQRILFRRHVRRVALFN